MEASVRGGGGGGLRRQRGTHGGQVGGGVEESAARGLSPPRKGIAVLFYGGDFSGGANLKAGATDVIISDHEGILAPGREPLEA